MNCTKCGTGLSAGPHITGLCRSCFRAKITKCKTIGCGNRVTAQNKSGYCRIHLLKQRMKSYCSRDLKNLGHWVLCHNSKNFRVKCRNRFRIDTRYQHPEMAWCDTCRKSEEYVTYGGGCVIQSRGATA